MPDAPRAAAGDAAARAREPAAAEPPAERSRDRNRGASADPDRSVLERLVRRHRLVVLAGLVALTGLAWLHLAGMGSMTVAPDARPWSPEQLLVLFWMWAIMMVAMMVPSAAPMILLFAGVSRRRRERRRAAVSTGVFLLGYLLVWTAYSAVAAGAQWALHEAALLTPAMSSASPYLAGAILVAAGAYQWTPVKDACLTACRSPLGFITTEWREGARGAVIMGVRHGHYCVGCCWALMALLFVAGVMNLLWVAAIAGLVLVEKVVPGGRRLGRATGLLLAGWGAWLVVGALV